MERTAKKKTSNGKFDPSKRYQWDEQDEFTVTGAEIDAWNRAINVMVANPEFQQFLHVQKAAIAMQNFLKESVEQGVIKEAAAPASVEAAPDLKVVKEDETPQNGQEEVSEGALAD